MRRTGKINPQYFAFHSHFRAKIRRSHSTH